MLGTVDRWFDENAFGFAKPDTLPFDVFVHADSLIDQGRLCVGQRITFDLAPASKKGLKPRAARVSIVSAANFDDEPQSQSKAARRKN